MRVEIKIPQQGLTTEYVLLKKWIIEKGSRVKANEPIAEIESEKAALEIESPAEGTLAETLAEPDDELEIQQVIGYIETEN